VEPEQYGGGNGEVQRQVGDVEQAGEAGEGVGGALQVCFDEQVQRSLERDEPVGVTLRFRRVPDDEAARELVEAVQDENRDRLGAERVSHGQPAAELGGRPCSDRGCGGGGHAALPRRSVAVRRATSASRQRSCSSIRSLGSDRRGVLTAPGFLELERERLDSADELGEFASLGAQLEWVQRAVRHGDAPSGQTIERSPGGAARDGSPACLGGEVECRFWRALVIDDRCRLAGVACQERDGSGREHEEGADHECVLVAAGCRLGDAVVAAVEQ